MTLQIHSLRRFLYPFLSLACILSMLVGSAAGCVAQPNVGGSIPLDTRFTKPASIIDLLRNFKIAMDEDLFLRDDFYSEDNLKRFSGGEQIVWLSVSSSERKNWGDISGFDPIAKPAQIDGVMYPGMTISFTQNAKDNKGEFTIWSLNIFDEKSPTFSDIERIFGTQWERPFLLHPPQISRAATHPMGNAHIMYEAATKTTKKKIVFIFGFDGKLAIASFSLRRSAQ